MHQSRCCVILRTWRPHKTMNYPSNCRRNLAPQKNQGVVPLQKWTTCLAALKSFNFEKWPCFRFSGIKMHSYSFMFAAFGWHLIPFVFGKHTNLPLENTLNSSTTAPVPTLSNRSVLAGVVGFLWCFVFFSGSGHFKLFKIGGRNEISNMDITCKNRRFAWRIITWEILQDVLKSEFQL